MERRKQITKYFGSTWLGEKVFDDKNAEFICGGWKIIKYEKDTQNLL
jgi:hypothetical protein